MIEEKSPQVLSSFVLKIIGFLLMTVDHTAMFLMARANNTGDAKLFQIAYVLRCIGRIAMPIFMFLTAEGVRHSRNPWKYFFRLFAMHFAISLFLTIYLYALPNPAFQPTDIEGTAFADLSLLALTLVLLRQKKVGIKLLALLPLALAGAAYGAQIAEHQGMIVYWFPSFLRPSYSLIGLLIGIGFYFATPLTDLIAKQYIKGLGIPLEGYQETRHYRRMNNIVSMSLFFLVVVVFWGISYIGYNYDWRPLDNYNMPVQSYCLLAMLPLFFYSGKRGYDSRAFRYISYFYYPVHMAILFLIFSL